MLKFIDLFCGLGGFRIALEKACKQLKIETKCVFSCDIKPIAKNIYKKNFKETPFDDITQIDTKDIPDFDILCAGFPCQAFSNAGKRLGFEDTRGTLFFEVARILKDKKPNMFILENVEGLVSHNKGTTFKTILNTLENDLEYFIQFKVLDAKDYSLPQSRKRIYIFGTKRKINNVFEFNKYKKNIVLNDIIDYHNTNFEESDFIDSLLKYYNSNELNGKTINDKRGGDNNIHSWDICLKGEITPLQKDIMKYIMKERRKRYIALEQDVPWKDGLGLTFSQIKKNFDIQDKQLLKLLNDLVNKKYLKHNYPKINNVYFTNKEKNYDISTGKLSFPITYIIDKNSYAPTLTATDLPHIGVSFDNKIRKLSKEELKKLFGYPKEYNLNDFSLNDCYDLFGNTICVNVVENILFFGIIYFYNLNLSLDNKKDC